MESVQGPGCLWRVKLPRSIFGSMKPTYDPVTQSLLVSDGWGTAYASIRLRRLDIFSGEGLASVRLGNTVRCIARSAGDSLYAVLDKRIVAVDHVSLTVQQKWTERVPSYGDYAVATCGGIVLMNSHGPNVHFYPLSSGQRRRREVASCHGMYAMADDRILVCSGKEGMLRTFCHKTGQVDALCETEPFKATSFHTQSQRLLLLMGDPTKEAGFFESLRGSRIQIYAGGDGGMKSISCPMSAQKVAWLGPSELCVCEDNAVETYEVLGEKLRQMSSTRGPRKCRIEQIVPELRIAIATDSSDPEHTTLAAIPLP
jgi:hypothetical protein